MEVKKEGSMLTLIGCQRPTLLSFRSGKLEALAVNFTFSLLTVNHNQHIYGHSLPSLISTSSTTIHSEDSQISIVSSCFICSEELSVFTFF